jgi:hypothetical protein
VSGEQCSKCGAARTGWFRYCLSCGFDFDAQNLNGKTTEPRDIRASDSNNAAFASGEMQNQSSEVSPLVSMSEPAAPSEIAASACPFLGLVDDPETHFMFAAPGHRCRADSKPARISLPHQGSYCLSVDYPACPLFKGATQAPDRRATPILTKASDRHGRPTT